MIAAVVLLAVPTASGQAHWRLVPSLDESFRHSNTGAHGSVALDGEWAAVASNVVDLDGVEQAGAVHVFRRTAAGWAEEAVLRDSVARWREWFGGAVALSGGTLLVGHPGDEAWSGTGEVRVFEHTAAGWARTATLRPHGDPARYAGGQFGQAVAIDGDRVLVGAPEVSVAGDRTGAAFVFERRDGGWAQTAELLPGEGDRRGLEHFGTGVDIEGGMAVVGSLGLRYNAACTVFEQGVEGWAETGRIPVGSASCRDAELSDGRIAAGTTIYERDGGAWVRTATVQSRNPHARGAASVSLEGDLLAIGYGQGNQTGFVATVHRRGAAGWDEIANLTAPGEPWRTCCADRVAIDTTGGARVLVGFGQYGFRAGTAYVFGDLDAFSVAREEPGGEAEGLRAFPNPFAAAATVTVTVRAPGEVRGALFDVLGRRVRTLAPGRLEAGRHTLRVEGAGLAPGVYVLRLTAAGHAQTIRLVRAE